MSTERVIIQSAIADQLILEIKNLVSQLKAGDLNEQGVSLGALFAESSADTVITMIKEAEASGAEIVAGDVSRQRSVLAPHLVKNVKPGMRLWDKESFGPVIAFTIVETIDEAVDMANATEYSLSASVWTNDIYQGQQVAFRIRAGVTNVNGPTVHGEPRDSLLGLGGASGYGRFHVENFTDKRVIVTHPLGRNYPLFS
jgi:acyl-CoA reductase-like NAD-dependent aldehyde dehydrogenase